MCCTHSSESGEQTCRRMCISDSTRRGNVGSRQLAKSVGLSSLPVTFSSAEGGTYCGSDGLSTGGESNLRYEVGVGSGARPVNSIERLGWDFIDWHAVADITSILNLNLWSKKVWRQLAKLVGGSVLSFSAADGMRPCDVSTVKACS